MSQDLQFRFNVADMQRYEALKNAVATVHAFAGQSISTEMFENWNRMRLHLLEQYMPETDGDVDDLNAKWNLAI